MKNNIKVYPKRKMTSLSKLPLNILLEVMGENLKIAFYLILSHPKLGRYSIMNQVQLQRIFLVRDTSEDRVVVYLLNGRVHRPLRDGPAIHSKLGGVAKAWCYHGAMVGWESDKGTRYLYREGSSRCFFGLEEEWLMELEKKIGFPQSSSDDEADVWYS
jgi:hypothetical protein